MEAQVLTYLEEISRRLKKIEERLDGTNISRAEARAMIAQVEARGGSVLDLCRPKPKRKRQ